MTGAIHLTFDDGPDEHWTPLILEELERLGAKATFFMVGERAMENSEVVVQVKRAGHQIELHCMRHVSHASCWRANAEEDTASCLDVLRRFGVEPRHWRPPGGGVASWTPEVARSRGLRLAGWSADSFDWRDDRVATILANVSPGIEDRGVVLMHDAVGPAALRRGCAGTVESIAPLVELIRDRGLEPDVLGEGSPLQERGFTLYSPRSTGRAPYRRPDARSDLRTTVVAEAELAAGDRADIARLIAAGFGRPLADEYGDRGWRRLQPVSRIVVRAGETLVAHASVVALEADPPLPAYGIADGVVASDRRGEGIGGRIAAAAAKESWRLGAEVVLTDSVDLERAFVSLGFEPVPRFACYYERDGACHWHRHWLAAFRSGPPGVRLRLADGDF